MKPQILVAIGEQNSYDVHYRYKRPRFETQKIGRGNGMKTELFNLHAVACALLRPPSVLIKFLQSDLNTSISQKNNVVIIKGDVCSSVEGSVNAFIARYVLCGSCGNPETDLHPKNAKMRCKACGMDSKLDGNDKVFREWRRSHITAH